MLAFGPFELDGTRRTLHRDGKPLVLRSSAFEVLLALVERAGEVVTKRLLCERAWPGRDVDENNLQVEVSALRKLLGAGAIVTASGRGYQFAWAVTDLDSRGATLVGREPDLAALRALLAPGELVSVVGEGGVGKTRLAQAVAAGEPDACVVRFDEVHDEAGMLRVIAEALKVDAVSRPALFDALRQGTRLLLLDTCDGVLRPLAELAGSLASECPGVALLATSREVLRLPGERVYRLATLAPADALECLTQCLRSAQRPIAADGHAAARELCERLGGNPLAIEIAARRAAGWGLAATGHALEERLDWQGDPESGAPARHHSLRASLAWSCRSLAPLERQLLAALAALQQPFELDALLALPLNPPLDRWERLEALGRLVDKSLLGVESAEATTYRLSATSQLYARRMLG